MAWLWAGLMASAAAPARAESAHWLTEAADQALAQDNVDGAIQALRAYQVVTGDGEVWFRIAELLERRNRFTEAIDAYEKYTGTDEEKIALIAKRVYQLQLRDDEKFFVESLSEAQRAEALAVRAFREGRRLILAKDYAAGIGYLQAATLLDPSLPGPHRLLGATYNKTGKSEVALQHLAEYLRIRPDGPLADRVRAMLKNRNMLGQLDAKASFPCSVWINGRYMGVTTPASDILLPRGYHIVAFVSRTHHLVKTFRIRIEADRRHVVDFRYGVIRVKLDPWGRIRANGRDLGLWDELGLPAGRYRLDVRSHDEAQSTSKIWTVTAGETRELTWEALSQVAGDA